MRRSRLVCYVGLPARAHTTHCERRRPERTALYEVVRDNLETLLLEAQCLLELIDRGIGFADLQNPVWLQVAHG